MLAGVGQVKFQSSTALTHQGRRRRGIPGGHPFAAIGSWGRDRHELDGRGSAIRRCVRSWPTWVGQGLVGQSKPGIEEGGQVRVHAVEHIEPNGSSQVTYVQVALYPFLRPPAMP